MVANLIASGLETRLPLTCKADAAHVAQEPRSFQLLCQRSKERRLRMISGQQEFLTVQNGRIIGDIVTEVFDPT